jgi:hypothetical protein
MAAGAFSRGVLNILNGTIDLDTTALKFMLAKSTYSFDPDHSAVSSVTEISATNYTGGFGGGGRKAATVTLTEQTASNRVVTIFGNLTWTALGGGANDTVQAGVLIREITNDAASIPIVFLDFTGGNVTTNGSDFTINFDATNGNLRWAV